MSSQDPVPGTPDDQTRTEAPMPADPQPAGSHQAPASGQGSTGRAAQEQSGPQQDREPSGGAAADGPPSYGGGQQHDQADYGRPQFGQQPGPSQQGPYEQGQYQQRQQPSFGAQPGSGRPGAGQESYAQGNYGQATFHQNSQGAPMSPGDARTWALASHVAAPVLNLVTAGWVGFLAPLILWLVFKDRDPLVRNAAAGAFNFNVIVGIVNIVLWIITFVTLGLGVIITGPLLFIVWVLTIVFAVQGAVKANRGQAYRYPMQIPILT